MGFNGTESLNMQTVLLKQQQFFHIGSNEANTTLTVNGTGFSTTAADNRVTIGGVLCVSQAATSTQIQCAIGKGAAGIHDVYVTVAQKGKARYMNGVLQFTYGLTISSFEPKEGSLGGRFFSLYIYTYYY